MIINVQLKANINCSMTTAKFYSGKNSTTTTTDRPWFIFTLFSRAVCPNTSHTVCHKYLEQSHQLPLKIKESIIKAMVGIHLVLAIPSHYRHYPVKAIALFGNCYTRTKTYSLDFFCSPYASNETQTGVKIISIFVCIHLFSYGHSARYDTR